MERSQSRDFSLLTAEKRKLLDLLLRKEGLAPDPHRAIPRRANQEEAPVSFAQQRLWVLDQLEPGSHYVEHVFFRLDGPLEHAALESAFNEILRRHESTRSVFALENGQLRQTILPPRHASIAVTNLESLEESRRRTEMQRLAKEFAQEPFDLRRAPLWRAKLFRHGPARHWLIVTTHHIASDGWSFNVFFRELAALYGAFAAKTTPALPELPIQYADYAAWQRDWLRGEVLDEHLGYWREQLADAPTLLTLPSDRPRGKTQTFRGACELFTLPEPLVTKLHAMGQRENCTLFMTLLSCFNTLLFRYTGQRDLVIGTPIANRNHSEIENLLGFFANTLLLRAKIEPELPFRELLQRVRNTALGAYAHPELPFEKLVEELQPERSTAYNPLFQVLFILQGPLPRPISTHGATVSYDYLDSGKSKLDLTLCLAEMPDGGAQGLLEYSTDLFERTTMLRLLEHFRNILQAVSANPALPVGQIPLLAAAEEELLLHAWNGTHRPLPPDERVQDLLEAQAARTPNAVAAAFSGKETTYRELNARANRLAHRLIDLGVKPGVLVGISLERSVEMLVAVLAVLKSGGAHVPLDPAFPHERLALMLADAQPAVILCESSLRHSLPESNATTICMDDPESFAGGSDSNPSGRCVPGDLAYVLYTSGSTGKPKGVQIPQRALVNFLRSMREKPGIGAADCLAAVTTLSFDIAALELLLPLTVGARVLIVPRETAADGAALGTLLRQARVTMMQATPATWRILLDSGWSGAAGFKALCGGEALTRELADRLLERCASLWNMYGPTETTVWSSTNPVERGDGPVLFGLPIANTQFYVLDERRQPAPLGVPGELYIGGEGVARGYLNRPGLNAEKFLANPFSGTPGARMYRTGDLVRHRPNGLLEYLGRGDNQVKIRGFRVELGEIEAALSAHAAVRECAVVARPDGSGENRLLAYVSLRAETPAATALLRSHLSERLPEYMVPSVFQILEALPLTPNGKLDRRALPEPQFTRDDSGPSYTAPRSALEEILCDIVAEVLHTEKVGIHDNFFSLGGHSLLATQAVSRIRETLKLDHEIAVRTLFEAPTVAQLSEAILGAHEHRAELERMAELLLQVANLPEEQVNALLKAPKEEPA